MHENSNFKSEQQIIQSSNEISKRLFIKTNNGKIIDSTNFRLFENQKYPFCSDISKYQKILQIGGGTYGRVFKGKSKETGCLVAIKTLINNNEDKEGFSITTLREIKILKILNNENIVRLIDICSSEANAKNNYKNQFHLVFEFCEHDLAGLLSNNAVRFTISENKNILKQIFNGLFFIHQNGILHRDIKSANILVNKEGVIKIADFGLAREIDLEHLKRYTNRVVTLWYRPPELLLGERNYTSAIDMWGVGCIMAELWTRSPIFKGDNDYNQLKEIIKTCGSINEAVWSDVKKYDLFQKLVLPQGINRCVKKRFELNIKNQYALDLLDRLLTLDPNNRINCDEALDHDFFWTEPLPTSLKIDTYIRSMYSSMPQPKQNLPSLNDQYCDRVY